MQELEDSDPPEALNKTDPVGLTPPTVAEQTHVPLDCGACECSQESNVVVSACAMVNAVLPELGALASLPANEAVMVTLPAVVSEY